jgi:hypothetical protein
VLDRNEAIETLKTEVEVLGAEKTRLMTEVVGLSTARAESLRKQVEAAKTAEALAVERTSKDNETADNLRKEIDAKKKSSLALQQQVELLTGCLEAVKGLALATVKMYVAVLWQFGGSTSDMPKEPISFSLLSWMKAHLEKFPTFVGGVVDFGALAGATNYAEMLARRGCAHTEGVQKEKLGGPSDLGTTSPSLRKSIQNFMSSF